MLLYPLITKPDHVVVFIRGLVAESYAIADVPDERAFGELLSVVLESLHGLAVVTQLKGTERDPVGALLGELAIRIFG